MNFKVVYDRKHLFGLGPIPKPKLKTGRNFQPNTETYRNRQILCWKALFFGSGFFFLVSCQLPK